MFPNEILLKIIPNLSRKQRRQTIKLVNRNFYDICCYLEKPTQLVVNSKFVSIFNQLKLIE